MTARDCSFKQGQDTDPKESGKSKGTAGAVRKRKAPGAVRYRPYPVGHPRRGVR